MSITEPRRIKTIGEFHGVMGLPKPQHPLISVIDLAQVNRLPETVPTSQVLDFYTISLKRHGNSTFKYGQQQYAVQGGVMYFMAPGQVFTPPVKNGETRIPPMSGWSLYMHPDFLLNTPLAKTIRKYDYFDYSVNEALLLTKKEEDTLLNLMQTIQLECFANPDKFSQDIIISMTDLLLNYADRFYHRQFLTNKTEDNQLLTRLDDLLTTYFTNTDLLTQGLPSVQFVAEKLHLSPNYLSSLLKALTGRNTQQHIQDKIIEQAKEKIAATALSVGEISYELGFDHPQSFSRLFKAKTGLSPLAFRQTFH